MAGKCSGGGGPGDPIDAPLPDGPADDIDGDGVKNIDDNCVETRNADQNNEDDDSLGDACDNCPHVKNDDQAKNTGDSVGSACDPRPAEAGDKVLAFHTFLVAPPGVTTTGSQGTWETIGGTYRFTGDHGYVAFPTTYDGVTIQVGGRLVTTLSELALRVIADARTSSDLTAFHGCGYDDCASPLCNNEFFSADIVQYSDANGFRGFASERPNAQLTGDYTIRMSIDSGANRINCTTTDTRGSVTRSTTNAAELQPGRVGVMSAFGTSHSLRYFIVIGP